MTPARHEQRSKKIGESLVWLVLGAILPLLVFGAFTAWTIVSQKQEAVASALANTASALLVAVDRELLNQFHAMEVLASDSSLDGRDPAAFSVRAQRALQANPQWRNIGLIDASTAKIIAGAPSVPNPFPTSLSPSHVAEAVRNRQPVIAGTFSQSRLSLGPIVLVMVPIVRQDQVRYVLGVAMDPNNLSAIFTAQGMASSWTGAVVDSNMVISGRSRDAARYVGLRATPSLESRIRASAGDMFTALTQDGQSVHTIFRRSPLTGWSVVIGVPDAEVTGPIRTILLQVGGAALATALLAALFALVIGHGISTQRNAYENALRLGQIDRQEALDRLIKIADNLPGVVYQFRRNPDGTYCFPYASEALQKIYHVSPQEAIVNADVVFANLHPDDLPHVQQAIEKSAQELSAWSQEYRVKFSDGTVRFLYGNAIPQAEAHGGVLWHGFITDITTQKENNARALQNEQKFGAILEGAADAIFITDLQGHYQYVNTAASNLLGYSHDALLKMSIADITPTQDLPHILTLFQTLVTTGTLRTEIDLKRQDGTHVPVAFNGTVLPDGNIFGSCRDISDRREAEEKLKESETHLQTIIENEPECIMILDVAGRVLQMNPAGLAMVEAHAWGDLDGVPFRNFIAPEHRDVFTEMHNAVIQGDTRRLEFEVLGLKGTRRWLESQGVPMQEHGAIVHLSVTRDISQRREMEAQVRQLAFHDALTGLPNRRLMLDRLDQAMSSSARNTTHAALLFLDLDNFKPLNDAHGHAAGDLLLAEVAHRLTQCVRGIDTVSRFGGDEFVVLLRELSHDAVEARAQALHTATKIHNTLSEPYILTLADDAGTTQSITHRCTASIGLALFAGHITTANEVLRQADAAMYLAKSSGRNTVRMYAPE